MQRNEDDLTEDDLKEMTRIADKSSPHSPYFDNVQGYQDPSEVAQVEDWAKEMRKRDHSIPGSKIRPNVDDSGKKDDPPDILVEMDGKLVGIEVTNLMEYVKENQVPIVSSGKEAILTWKYHQGQIVFSWSGSALDDDERKTLEEEVRKNPRCYRGGSAEWSLESFQQRLREIVVKKDELVSSKKKERVRERGEQALERRMNAIILLIFTPELYLQHNLPEYVEKTELRPPDNFDRIFLMGRVVPRQEAGSDLVEEDYPVFEFRLSEEVIS